MIVADRALAAIFYAREERPIVEGVVHRMVGRAIEMEGTVTGEHGVGLVKREYLPHELGQSTVDAMRRVYNTTRRCLCSLTDFCN